MLHTGYCCLINACIKVINARLWISVMFLCANATFLCRQRPAAGACLAELTGTFPVCFLEPGLNQNNPYSIYNTTSALEREGICFSLL